MKIVRNPNQLPATLRIKINRAAILAMNRWADLVIEDASSHAPIDTGQLRRSITKSNVVSIGGTLTIKVGPDSTVESYAPGQEFDTTQGFGRTSIAEHATRPWLSPAFKRNIFMGRNLLARAFERAFRP